MEYKENIGELYLNYMRALEIRQKYGDKYGDTDDMLKLYEKKLEKILKPKKTLSLEKEKHE